MFDVLRAVLKLLKMAQSVRTLLDTVVQALPEVSNLGLLFFLLFFIFAALGVELFGRVGACCSPPVLLTLPGGARSIAIFMFASLSVCYSVHISKTY